jgi:1-deoxy-D-xylulose-5-phosphate reductoisomerase
MMKRKVIILGATGSIGTQAIDVASSYSDRIEVVALSAHSNAQALFDLARKFQVRAAALTGSVIPIPDDLKHITWYFGQDALERMSTDVPCDDVLVAVTGMFSLRCVMSARRQGKRILLANKETLVAGGQWIMPLCEEDEGEPTIIPIDSEHSAIFQCLKAAQGNPFNKLILTASGGPFRTWSKADIQQATIKQALNHPNWEMGKKITIDSASMFNKALEVIEAKWLFHAEPEQIEVLIHPQSIVHSMVSFADGAVLAQLGVADMRIPIMYAMLYPHRLPQLTKELSLSDIGSLTFEKVNDDKFPSIQLAYDALRMGGAASCVLNAANEVAVNAFLNEKIRFGDIYHIVYEALNSIPYQAKTVDDLINIDQETRDYVKTYIERRN